MNARSFARGHFDGRSPLYRIVLFAQEPPRYQGVLFTTAAPEMAAAPACTHPELGVQADLRRADPLPEEIAAQAAGEMQS